MVDPLKDLHADWRRLRDLLVDLDSWGNLAPKAEKFKRELDAYAAKWDADFNAVKEELEKSGDLQKLKDSFGRLAQSLKDSL